MTQKRIRPRISEELQLLRKKRDEAVLAVGKIDREIDEAIAKAKIPQLEVGDLFVCDSSPIKWTAAIITGSQKHDLEPLKIRHSTNLGIHCHTETLLINITSPYKIDRGYSLDSSKVDWIFNSEDWLPTTGRSYNEHGVSFEYEKRRWELDQDQYSLNYKGTTGLNIESTSNDDLNSTKGLVASDEKREFMPDALLELRSNIRFYLQLEFAILKKGWELDFFESLIPMRWYTVTDFNPCGFWKDRLCQGENIILLLDGIYDSRFRKILSWGFNQKKEIPFNIISSLDLELVTKDSLPWLTRKVERFET